MQSDGNVVPISGGLVDLDALKEEYRKRAEQSRTVIVPLATPIQVEGVEKDELTLRRPNVGELRNMDKRPSEMEQEVYLVAKCAGIGDAALNRMDPSDYALCASVVAGFLGSRPPSAQ